MAIVYAIFTLEESLKLGTHFNILDQIGAIEELSGKPIHGASSYIDLQAAERQGALVMVNDPNYTLERFHLLIYDVRNDAEWLGRYADQLAAFVSEAMQYVPVKGDGSSIDSYLMTRADDPTKATLVYSWPYNHSKWATALMSAKTFQFTPVRD